MVWLKDGTLTHNGDREMVFSAILRRLQHLQIPVEKQDIREGVISVRCVSRCLDLGIWRCWSDKLVIQVTSEADRETRVRVDAVPNLFRTRLREGEREIALQQVMAELGRLD